MKTPTHDRETEPKKDFFQYIDLLTYDQAVYARMEDLLKEEQ